MTWRKWFRMLFCFHTEWEEVHQNRFQVSNKLQSSIFRCMNCDKTVRMNYK